MHAGDREVRDAAETHALAAPATPTTAVRRFRLVVVRGEDAGAALTSSTETVVVGTHESADLVLRDPTVSRFHCEIRVSDGNLDVRDLQSRNGTCVDGVRVFHARLRGGSKLLLGNTEVLCEIGTDDLQLAISPGESFGTMVGRSIAMRRVFALLARAAANDSSILLMGETGTGKEAAAESIHLASPRRDGPFVVVDCGAVPPELLESELFGHERGAFTGATTAREGAFEAASGGTIFLDEIGELSLELQPKLLRVLEKRESKRVGSNVYRPVDVRVVAATNRSLRAEVNEKRFRSDLYFRLAVVELRLPPLRERPDDLPVLVRHLLSTTLAPMVRPGAPTPELMSDELGAELARHGWPGNVRELRNYLERCLSLRERVPLSEAGVEQVSVDGDSSSPDPSGLGLPLKLARERAQSAFERRYLEHLMPRAGGNVTAASKLAGIDRIHLYRLLWRHGMR